MSNSDQNNIPKSEMSNEELLTHTLEKMNNHIGAIHGLVGQMFNLHKETLACIRDASLVIADAITSEEGQGSMYELLEGLVISFDQFQDELPDKISDGIAGNFLDEDDFPELKE
jgi:hypothetical protein